MGDFVPQSNVKSAVREIATPIADVTAFNTIVQAVLTTNPFGCTAYETSGEQFPAVAIYLFKIFSLNKIYAIK